MSFTPGRPSYQTPNYQLPVPGGLSPADYLTYNRVLADKLDTILHAVEDRVDQAIGAIEQQVTQALDAQNLKLTQQDDRITDLANTLPTIHTTLPGSPGDGDEVYFVADAAGSIWHLRYRATAPAPYRWEFLGGAPLVAYVAADLAITATSPTYVVLAGGPSLSVPRPGRYVVGLGAEFSHPGKGGGSVRGVSLKAGGTTTAHPTVMWYGDHAPGEDEQNGGWEDASGTLYSEQPWEVTTAATLVEMSGARLTTHEAHVSRRVIIVRPIRVG